MAKKEETAIAVRREAGLAARALERLETEAQKTLDKGRASSRSMRLVSSTQGLQALIKAPGVSIQIDGDTFAVDVAGQEEPAE